MHPLGHILEHRLGITVCLPQSGLGGSYVADDFRALDWRWLVHHLIGQGLAPLFMKGALKAARKPRDSKEAVDEVLQRLSGLGIPASSAQLLCDSYFSTLARTLAFRHALGQIDAASHDAGVRCIVWKGAALAGWTYPSLGLRPMDDIDLIISPTDIDRLRNLLKKIGYEQRPGYPLVWQRPPVTIDLHFDVVHSDRIARRLDAFPVGYRALARKAQPLDEFEDLLRPCPQDMFICLAIHAMKHGYAKAIWIMDALYLLSRYPKLSSEPAQVMRRVEEFGAELPVGLLLNACRKFDPRLNRGLENRLRSRCTGLLARIQMAAISRNTVIPHIGELFFLHRVRPLRKKLQFVTETLRPGDTVARQLYPGKDGQSPLRAIRHLLLRLARLAAMAGRSLYALIRMIGRAYRPAVTFPAGGRTTPTSRHNAG